MVSLDLLIYFASIISAGFPCQACFSTRLNLRFAEFFPQFSSFIFVEANEPTAAGLARREPSSLPRSFRQALPSPKRLSKSYKVLRD